MKYYIQRGNQEYGPYSLVDLRKYVSEGNIVPNDLARREDSSDWIPVSQVLASAGSSPPPSQPEWGTPQGGQPEQPQQQTWQSPQQPQQPPQQPGAQQSGAQWGSPQPPQQAQQPAWGAPQQQNWGQQAAGQPGAGPIPSDLHWALVLVLGVVTCGIFNIVWSFIEASFVKKLDPQSKGLTYMIIYIAGYVVAMLASVASASANEESLAGLSALFSIAALVFFLLAFFNMRDSLQKYYNTVERYGLRLSGPMTFFFNVLYFQYHLSKIAQWKKTGIKA